MLQVFLADQGPQVLQDLLVKMASQDSLAPVACLALKVPLVRLVVKVPKVINSPTGFHLVTASLLAFWGLFVCLFWSCCCPLPWFTGYGYTLYMCEVQKGP